MAPSTTTVGLRLPDELVEAVDRYTDHLRATMQGLNVTRNDAVRRLVVMSLRREGFIASTTTPE